MNSLKIKCPTCSAVIDIDEYRPEFESKSLTCPECHVKALFREWERINVLDQTPPPPVPKPQTPPIGKLIIPSLNIDIQLREGTNVIGRGFGHTESKADFKIPINANPQRTSREHIIIEVSNSQNSGYTHTLSLYKQAINETRINNSMIRYGDRIPLKHGDVINLPDIDVIFELHDNDRTEYYTQYV